MLGHKYIYDVELRSVYDGDTIRVDIDLGFGHKWQGIDGKGVKLRLYGINTPEVRGEEREQGLISKQALIDLLGDRRFILQTVKDRTGKYGRYLAILWLESINEESGSTDYVNVNNWLVENGYAVKANY